MRILQVNSVCGWQSTGHIVTDLQTILRQQGHDCIVAYGEEKSRHTMGNVHIGREWDRYCHALKTRLWDAHGFGSAKPTLQLLSFTKDYHPDIIHLHNIHGYYLHIGRLFEYLSRQTIPVVWTLHDCWAFTGHCAHFDYVGCSKWGKGCHHCPQLREYPASILIDGSQSNYREKRRLFTSVPRMTIVTPSHWLAGLVSQSFLGQYPIKVFPNGIDLSVFRPTPSTLRETYGLSGKAVILGVSNQWVKKKGFDDLLALAQRLDDSYRLVLVGVTKEQKKQLPRQVIGIIHTADQQELSQWYTLADVFVNPTYEDTFPFTNMEAQACGTPIITYATGGCPETMGKWSGIMLEERSVEALASAIYQGAWKQFSTDQCVAGVQFRDKCRCYAEYLSLYESLIKE